MESSAGYCSRRDYDATIVSRTVEPLYCHVPGKQQQLLTFQISSYSCLPLHCNLCRIMVIPID